MPVSTSSCRPQSTPFFNALLYATLLVPFQVQSQTVVTIPAGYHKVPANGSNRFVTDDNTIAAEFRADTLNLVPDFYLAGQYSMLLCGAAQQKPGCILPQMPDVNQIDGINTVTGKVQLHDRTIFFSIGAFPGKAYGWFVFNVPTSLASKYQSDGTKFQDLWWRNQMLRLKSGLSTLDAEILIHPTRTWHP